MKTIGSKKLSVLFICLAVASAAVMSGCKYKSSIIQKATFQVSENLETVRVSLVFTDKIKSDLAGGFTLKDYGYLFINPFTQAQPFEIGFSLNTSIVNDQDYISLTPTMVLPNGVPIGIPYGLVEIRSPNPISPKFDIFGYVDVLHANWVGVAAMFGFLNDEYFPEGLTVSQAFLNDGAGHAGIIASVFGPTLKADGTLQRAGGIAVFANIRQLINQGQNYRGKPIDAKPLPKLYIQGPNAASYEHNGVKLQQLENNLVRGMNLK
ncbi:hypothetical protein WDW86_10485 [Bdellovibrionota bacterium FG-2]